VNVLPATKGRDSIVQGIQYVQDQRISITRRSINGIDEYMRYLWQQDKDGRVLNVPIDIWNHFLDAVRYGFDALREQKTKVATFEPVDSVTGYGTRISKGYQPTSKGYRPHAR
jgi:phage terminase large subunit